MRNGIFAPPVDVRRPFAVEINRAAIAAGFSPILAYAIKLNETADLEDAATIVSGDGGHGLFQLTSSFPSNWADPLANAAYAIANFLAPAESFWSTKCQGDALVRCIAAEFNAGRGNALAGHNRGNVDLYTTNEYAARALAHYKALQ